MDVTNLKQAENRMEVEGILAEKELSDKSTDDTLMGSFSVKIDDLNTIKMNFRADKLIKNGPKTGEPNPSYESLKKFYDTANAIANVGEENATKVYTNRGKLNPYHSAVNNKDYMNYQVSFIGEYRGKAEEWDPRAEVTVEGYIASIYEEVDNEGTSTGRLVMKIWMPTYNSIEPVTLIVPEEIADAVSDGYEVGQTALFIANVVNNRIEKKTETVMKIGKPKITVEYDYTNELILTGASEAYDEDGAERDKKPYDANAIKKAITEREARIKEAADKSKSVNTDKKPTAAGTGRTISW